MNLQTSKIEEQLQVITAGTAEIISIEELRKKLHMSASSGKPLRVKLGIDPTNPDIHIGHMVPCRKLRDFQNLGHTAVLLIGDHTARIGDPTGAQAERPALTVDEIARNMATYTQQLFKILDPEKTEVVLQSSWYENMKMADFVRLASRFSVARMLSHETFRKRLDSGNKLSLHEMLYPVIQAQDSVEIKADIELGGTDQRFNCLCGRDLQRSRGDDPQVVITLPLLKGLDLEKMSKSKGNHISILSGAGEKIGRIMSVPDSLLNDYIELASSWDIRTQIEKKADLASGRVHPMKLKLGLAKSIASVFHSKEEVDLAADEFERVFSQREIPSDIPILRIDEGETGLIEILLKSGFVSSTSEARRLIAQGGIEVDGVKVTLYTMKVAHPGQAGIIVRIGKRRYLRIEAVRF
jgi:tyrosyl-tRNA synthetase